MKPRTFHSSISHQHVSWVLRTLSIARGPSLRLLTFGPGSSCQTDGEFSNNTSFIRTNNDSRVLGPPPSPAGPAGRPTPPPAAPRPPSSFHQSFSIFQAASPSLARNHISPALPRPLPFLALSLPGHFWRPRCDCRWVA